MGLSKSHTSVTLRLRSPRGTRGGVARAGACSESWGMLGESLKFLYKDCPLVL